MSIEDFKKRLYDCVVSGNVGVASKISDEITEKKIDMILVGKVLIDAMNSVGHSYREREIALPQLLLATHSFKKVLASHPAEAGKEKGVVVLGTVQNDIHDIGKNLVAGMLQVFGYKVYDMGKDVTPERFLEKAKEVNANIVGASTLMTSTMPNLESVIALFEQQGMRDRVKIMVGGAPITPDYAKHIKADGYAVDAILAVETADKLMKGENCYLKPT